MAAEPRLPRTHGARSEVGYVRTANEDRMAWSRAPYGDIYVVSDGMGGYRGGALAAETTVRALQEHLIAIEPEAGDFSDHLHGAFAAANAAVYERRRPDDPDTRDMGATGVVVIVAGARALVGHVGDSRAYLWRSGQLTQLTRDHTRVQRMVDAGLVTPAQAEVHPDASVLDRAIGHQPSVEADVSEWIALKPKDMLLLCSDGLCGYVSDAEMAGVLRSDDGPQALVDQLVQCALDKGGEDNVTVQLVRLGGRGSLADWFAKPLVVLPLCVITSAVVAHFIAQVQRDEDPRIKELHQVNREVAQLRARLESQERATAARIDEAVKLAVQAAQKPDPKLAAAPPAATTGAPRGRPTAAAKPKPPPTPPKATKTAQPESKPPAANQAEKKTEPPAPTAPAATESE